LDAYLQPCISTNTRGRYGQHPLELKRTLVALSLDWGAHGMETFREMDGRVAEGPPIVTRVFGLRV